jgi:hypothetical protein
LTVAAVVLVAAAVVAVLLAQGGGPRSTPTAAGVTPVANGPVQFHPRIALGRWGSAPLPGAGTVVSLDLSLDPGARGSLLVRPDGSTYQAVRFDRDTGNIVFIGTHQGLSDTSTRARGEGWGLYGFAQTAIDLHDRSLLAIAQRLAQYVAQHLHDGGVPRWDYNAGPEAQPDVSAGTITAAGMFRLALACRRLSGVCSDAGQWVSLGRTMLAASLAHASSRPPLGYLGTQVLDARHHGCWCNGTELIFGVSYALEALELEKTASS